MSGSLYSSSWYLVNDLVVCFRAQTEIHRHRYRGQIWYVLQDKVTGQYHRFSVESYKIIGLMDGERSLDQIWQMSCKILRDDMPSQDEVIGLVSKLFQANVLQSNKLPNIPALNKRYKSVKKRRLLGQLKSPLGIKVPLCDPETFLNRTMACVKPLLSIWGAVIWIAVILMGIILACMHWPELSSNSSDRILSIENLSLTFLVYPIVKIIHEFGHAYFVKNWGGEVHEMGIMFLVFFPVPYVEASAAIAFSSKYRRMLVGAAGILVEIFLAALAMIIWSLAEPGLVRALAFNTMLIAGISTLAFNGNPLLKFDAYYVLADYLEIPNLFNRSNQYVLYLFKRYVFRLKHVVVPETSIKEGFWLALYSVMSYVYRFLIMLVIALYITTKYFFIGILLALWSLYMSIIQPVCKLILAPFAEPALHAHRYQLLSIGTGLVCVLLIVLVLIPFPYTSSAQGVLVAPERAQLRTNTSGYIKSIHQSSGEWVETGSTVISLENAVIDTEVKLAEARVQEVQARYNAVQTHPAEAKIQRTLLAFTNDELNNARVQQQALHVKSHDEGLLVLPDQKRLPGRFYNRGVLLGYVIELSDLPVTVLVSEDDIAQVRHHVDAVELYLVSEPNQVYRAQINRIFPVSSDVLPSMVLATEGGGKIALNPAATEGYRTYERYYHVLLSLPPEIRPKRLNERVQVRFIHHNEALIYRWARALRRVFLKQLHV